MTSIGHCFSVVEASGFFSILCAVNASAKQVVVALFSMVPSNRLLVGKKLYAPFMSLCANMCSTFALMLVFVIATDVIEFCILMSFQRCPCFAMFRFGVLFLEKCVQNCTTLRLL